MNILSCLPGFTWRPMLSALPSLFPLSRPPSSPLFSLPCFLPLSSLTPTPRPRHWASGRGPDGEAVPGLLNACAMVPFPSASSLRPGEGALHTHFPALTTESFPPRRCTFDAICREQPVTSGPIKGSSFFARGGSRPAGPLLLLQTLWVLLSFPYITHLSRKPPWVAVTRGNPPSSAPVALGSTSRLSAPRCLRENGRVNATSFPDGFLFCFSQS